MANWTGRSIQGPDTAAATVNQGFASGATLAQWLQLVHASTTLGQIDVNTTRYDINGVNPPTQVWLNLNVTGNPVMQFTFDTPVGQTSGQCGRVLFNEYHVEGGVNSRGQIFPNECSSAATTPQEKLLEYSLFDLSNNGRPTTMTPTNAGFGDQVVGYASAAQTFTVTNNSVFAAALSSLSASDDFSATPSAACSSVAAGASCTVGVVFKPTTLGQHAGVLNLTFGGTALSAPLTGNGIAALRFQNASMDFGGTDVGTTTTRTELLTNLAPGPVAVPAFQVSGDYVAANNCPAILATAATCTLTLTFTPSVYGPRPGTLSSSSAGTANLSAMLTGNGYDFSTAVNPASGTVIAGLSTVPLAVTTPLGGFSAPVRFTCGMNVPGAACTLASQSVTLASAASFNLTVTTTSEYTLVGYGFGGSTLLALLAGLSTGALIHRRRRTTRTAAMLSVLCMAALVGGIMGCSGKQPTRNPVYTPAGVYPVTLTATDGILTRSATFQLTVKAN